MLETAKHSPGNDQTKIEELERAVARLDIEIHRLKNNLARHTRVHSWRDRVKGLVRGIIGFRLHTFEQHPPRPLRTPSWYRTPAAELKEPPTISIVTPSFNHGRFIEATLKSVLDQGYPRLEYMVQDGGSYDETMTIVDRYRPGLKHAASARDRGQSHAINLGFAHATGGIMAYLNSDDVLLPGSLHYVASYFAEHPEADVVYGHRIIINADGDELGRFVLPPHSDEMLSWADYVPQETVFWRRRIWERVGGAIDESFQFAMDWDLLLRFREAKASIVRLPRFLGAFRIHDAQKTQALLATAGEREMARLRRRVHGRTITRAEIRRALYGYVFRQGLYDRLYRWGILRY